MSLTGLNTRGHLIRKTSKQVSEDAWIIPKRTNKVSLGPDLPKVDGVVWCDQTKFWYREVRKSDIAQIYTDVEWQSVLMAALVHNEIWSGKLPNRERQTFQV